MRELFNENEFLSQLSDIVSIKSVKNDCGEVNDKYPLGKGIGEALEYVEALGKEMGFTTKNLDNKCVTVETGEGKRLLGILVHVDTVGADDKWSYEPFSLTREGDRLYGRGIVDDKGPMLIVLHIMKYLKENNLIGDKRIRLIVGGDEEAGDWECIKRYKATEEIPDISFSPDADYPVIFAEKGILRIKISKKNEEKDFVFEGGKTINTVPDFARCTAFSKEYEAMGKSAHAMEPHKGVNAVLKLADILFENGIKNSFIELLRRATVKGFNIELSDDVSGELTINPSVAMARGDECSLICDIRYPVTLDADDIKERISDKVSDLGYSVEIIGHQKPLYVEKNSHLVSTLLGVYNEIMGTNEEPLYMGGGTYARAFPDAVAFGIWFKDKESAIHQADEFWDISDIKKNFEILKEAIIRL